MVYENDGGSSCGDCGVDLPDQSLATMGPLGNELENNHDIIAGAYPTLLKK